MRTESVSGPTRRLDMTTLLHAGSVHAQSGVGLGEPGCGCGSLVATHDAHAQADALRQAADEHEGELVCCDVYDRLTAKPSATWTAEEKRERRAHDICYWGRACAVGDRERASLIVAQDEARCAGDDLRDQLLAVGTLTYYDVARRRGTTESEAEAFINAERANGSMFVVANTKRLVVPAVLICESGLPSPVARVVRPLLEAGLNPWHVWAWVVSATDWLSGDTPAAVAEDDLERADVAARRYAQEVTGSRGD
jgi:hypothetical protein